MAAAADSPDSPAALPVDHLSFLPTELSQAVFRYAGPGKHLYISKRLVAAAREERFRDLRVYGEERLDQLDELFSRLPQLRSLVRHLTLWVSEPDEDEWDNEEMVDHHPAVVFANASWLCEGCTNLRSLSLGNAYSTSAFLSPFDLPFFSAEHDFYPVYPHLSKLDLVTDPSFHNGALAAVLSLLPSLKELDIEVNYEGWLSFELDDEAPFPTDSTTGGCRNSAPRLSRLNITIKGADDAWLPGAHAALGALGGAAHVCIRGFAFDAAMSSIVAALPADVERLTIGERFSVSPETERSLAFSSEGETEWQKEQRLRRGLGDTFTRFTKLSVLELDIPLPPFVWPEAISTLPSLSRLSLRPTACPRGEYLLLTIIHPRAIYADFTHFQLDVSPSWMLAAPDGVYCQPLDKEGERAAVRYLRAMLPPWRGGSSSNLVDRERLDPLRQRGWRLPFWEGGLTYEDLETLVEGLAGHALRTRGAMVQKRCFHPLGIGLDLAWVSVGALMEEVARFQVMERKEREAQ
ncbi:hypothetical protein JCM6882_005689 [Rhodosporidiobolus microsporus]